MSKPVFFALVFLFALTVNVSFSLAQVNGGNVPAALVGPWEWETIETLGLPAARHEASMVALDGKLYLIGGRRINPVNVYDPATNKWEARAKPPIELHHFQAVAMDRKIYIVGAFTGKYPNEKPVKKVVVYDPATDTFSFQHTIPPARRRGAAGAVAYQGKIYLAGGITDGHVGGTRAWLDCYNPKNGDWRPLADSPHKRDHAMLAVCNEQLCFFAGRQTQNVKGFGTPTKEADFFDLATKQWLDDHASLPTGRAGNMVFVWGDEVIVGGGESGDQKKAHSELEAYNTKTKTWRHWPDLKRGRHGSSFAVIDDFVYVASGSGNRGGGPELTSLERLVLPPLTPEQTSQKSVTQERVPK